VGLGWQQVREEAGESLTKERVRGAIGALARRGERQQLSAPIPGERAALDESGLGESGE
jgi:hypothetical protein